jgi:hypothetical protein
MCITVLIIACSIGAESSKYTRDFTQENDAYIIFCHILVSLASYLVGLRVSRQYYHETKE